MPDFTVVKLKVKIDFLHEKAGNQLLIDTALDVGKTPKFPTFDLASLETFAERLSRST